MSVSGRANKARADLTGFDPGPRVIPTHVEFAPNVYATELGLVSITITPTQARILAATLEADELSTFVDDLDVARRLVKAAHKADIVRKADPIRPVTTSIHPAPRPRAPGPTKESDDHHAYQRGSDG